jgi:hypothetical protein
MPRCHRLQFRGGVAPGGGGVLMHGQIDPAAVRRDN